MYYRREGRGDHDELRVVYVCACVWVHVCVDTYRLLSAHPIAGRSPGPPDGNTSYESLLLGGYISVLAWLSFPGYIYIELLLIFLVFLCVV